MQHWRWCFLLPATIALLGAAVVWAFVRDTPSSVGLPELKTGKTAEKPQSKAEEKAEYKAFLRRKVFLNPTIWIIAVGNFFVYIVRFAVVQLKNGNGYDHNWVLNAKGDINRRAASLKSQKTGIVLDVYTNEPGVQVYAGNFLDGSLTGKKGITYNQRASVCLETQKYPDTPNKLEWPSAVLRPGEKYMSQCIFKFSVDK